MTPEVTPQRHRLSAAQKQFYHENGFLIGLPPVYRPAQVAVLNAEYQELLKLLRPGEDEKEIREWHETSRFLYDICVHPQILDYVEDLLGPNYYLWASNFFAKPPRHPSVVGWHQDAYYWPLSPHNSVTAWLAFTDSDEGNGAMRVIPKSQSGGLIKHQRSSQTDSVLTLELERGTFREDEAVPLVLKAGELSFHDDRMIHGSPANNSDRWRIGFTIRYSGTNVKCDLSVNPHFKTYLMRGVDEYRHNPVGTIPVQRFGRLERKHLSIEEARKDNWHQAKPSRA
ncbi:MAG TPA: phytanoyl-CoA dioxygenase family protein [Terriglobia bacterium]|nr:phytanoyl-CoA dioxygenase family protein [Terriglobia bacterium]